VLVWTRFYKPGQKATLDRLAPREVALRPITLAKGQNPPSRDKSALDWQHIFKRSMPIRTAQGNFTVGEEGQT